MPNLPVQPNLRHYGGSKENVRHRSAEYDARAQKVADHVNTLIASNADSLQQYYFANIARELGYSVEEVRSAISDGGYNGITFRVTEEDRRRLETYNPSG